MQILKLFCQPGYNTGPEKMLLHKEYVVSGMKLYTPIIICIQKHADILSRHALSFSIRAQELQHSEIMNTINVWFNAGVKINGTAQIVTGHNQGLIFKSQTTAGNGWKSTETNSTC